MLLLYVSTKPSFEVIIFSVVLLDYVLSASGSVPVKEKRVGG